MTEEKQQTLIGTQGFPSSAKGQEREAPPVEGNGKFAGGFFS